MGFHEAVMQAKVHGHKVRHSSWQFDGYAVWKPGLGMIIARRSKSGWYARTLGVLAVYFEGFWEIITEVCDAPESLLVLDVVCNADDDWMPERKNQSGV